MDPSTFLPKVDVSQDESISFNKGPFETKTQSKRTKKHFLSRSWEIKSASTSETQTEIYRESRETQSVFENHAWKTSLEKRSSSLDIESEVNVSYSSESTINSLHSTNTHHKIRKSDHNPLISAISTMFSQQLSRHEEFHKNDNEAPVYQRQFFAEEISYRTTSGLTDTDLEYIRFCIKEDHSVLFQLSDPASRKTHLDRIAKHANQTSLQPIFIDLIMQISQLKPDEIEKVKELIFSKSSSNNQSLFQHLMQGEASNVLFDSLLTTFSDIELNANPDRKSQILEYAFSMKRYNHITINPQNLPHEVVEKADECYASSQVAMQPIREILSKVDPAHYENWLSRRRLSSCTLAQGSSSQASACIERWNNADKLAASYAESAKEHPDQRFDQTRLQKIHLKLCKGEEGVRSPGKFREGIVRTSGGWTHVYCHQQFLERNIEQFLIGFNRGLQQCEDKELNPVIFASQIYQQFVSLHPFENGNGRISRLLMDYVLERFNLPPPILEENVLDAVFPLDHKKVDQGQFVEKIIEGIKLSKSLLVSTNK